MRGPSVCQTELNQANCRVRGEKMRVGLRRRVPGRCRREMVRSCRGRRRSRRRGVRVLD